MHLKGDVPSPLAGAAMPEAQCFPGVSPPHCHMQGQPSPGLSWDVLSAQPDSSVLPTKVTLRLLLHNFFFFILPFCKSFSHNYFLTSLGSQECLWKACFQNHPPTQVFVPNQNCLTQGPQKACHTGTVQMWWQKPSVSATARYYSELIRVSRCKVLTFWTYLKNSVFSSSLFNVRLFKKFTTSRKSFLNVKKKKAG